MSRRKDAMMKTLILMTTALALMTLPTVPAAAQQPTQAEVDRYVDLVRMDVRQGRAELVGETMQLSLRKSPDVDPEAIGDPFLHPGVFGDITERQLAGVFGAEFTAQLMDLPVGEWGGPITSAFGLHLARIDRLEPERPSTLDEVRDAVYRDLVSERTRKAEQRYFEGLLSQYTVTAEWPEGMEPVAIPGVVQ